MSRPTCDSTLLESLRAAVPSRLARKLERAPEVAESWSWSAQSDGITRIEAPNDVTVEIRGGAVTDEAQLVCSCLLAPRCLHRLAVASRLPPSADPSTDAGDDAPPPSTPRLPSSPVTPSERAAATGAVRALEAVVLRGLGGVGADGQGELLVALHHCRAAGLPRLATLLLAVLRATRAPRVGGRTLQERATTVGTCLHVAHTLSSAEQATSLERGLARRAYEPLPPTPCWGLACLPFGTDTGYAGITTWVVDRELQVSAVSTVRPSDSAGLTPAVAALPGASLTHHELATHHVILQGATRSLDGRIGTGARARVVVQGATSWWEGPPAELFGLPLEAQLQRALGARDLPPFLRPEGAALLFVDAVVTDTPGVICVQGRCLGLVPREGATAREAAQVAQLGAAAGASVRLLARVTRERRVVPLAVAGPDGAPWRLGEDDSRLAPWPALLDTHRVPPPPGDVAEAPLRPWAPLERVVGQVLLQGFRAVTPGHRAELDREAWRLRQAGLVGAAQLVGHLAQVARCHATDHAGRRLPPPAPPLARALAGAALYLQQVEDASERSRWTRPMDS